MIILLIIVLVLVDLPNYFAIKAALYSLNPT